MNNVITNLADVKENQLLHLDKEILTQLLKDRTTDQNILWCTDNYKKYGPKYEKNRLYRKNDKAHGVGENMAKINVKDTEINVCKVNEEDYFCLTDMIKAKDGDFFISDWLRNRNTLEYIGIWEKVYNPNFNYGEFALIKSQSGLNSFKISVKEFVEKTNAICI